MKIMYIDPMMGGSLAIYDMSLLRNIPSESKIIILGSSLYKDNVPDNMTFEPIFTYNRKSGIKKILSYLGSLWRIYKRCRHLKPDVIHIQWLKIHGLDSKFYLYLKRKFGVKIVFTAHNILPHDTGEKYYKTYKNFYYHIDAVIVHDKNTQKEMCEKFNLPEKKVNVIPHGLILFKGNEKGIKEEGEKFVDKYGIKENVIVFSSMGVQGWYKGTDVLLDIWANNELFNKNPNCALVIAGQSNDLDLSPISGVENVYIENGLLSDDLFNAIMCRTNVLLLPYRRISQSGVNMTAINFRIPVLVTEVGGLAEPLSKADIGWSISSCNRKLLEEKMLYLLDNLDEVVRKKVNNDAEWEKVQRAYSWSGIGLTTYHLYRAIAEQNETENYIS